MKSKIVLLFLMICSTQLFSQNPIVGNRLFSIPRRICMNSTILIITADPASGGNGTINYKWICSYTSDSTGYTDAPGTNNTQNYYPPSPFTDSVWYKRVVTSGTFVDTSNASPIFVITKFADFYSYNTLICEGYNVTFYEAKILNTSNSQLIGRKWIIDSIGDFKTIINGSSTINNKFLSPGNYNVKLVVEYTGCSDSVTKVITVLPKPKAKIGMLTNSMQCLGTNSFSFIDSSTYSGGNYLRKWTLSDIPNDTSILVNPIKLMIQ